MFKTQKEALAYEIFLHQKFLVKAHSLFFNRANQISSYERSVLASFQKMRRMTASFVMSFGAFSLAHKQKIAQSQQGPSDQKRNHISEQLTKNERERTVEKLYLKSTTKK